MPRHVTIASATFTSHKTTHPIQHHDGMMRDLLLQLTLDANVAKIGFIERAALDDKLVDVFATTIDRVDGRFAIDLEGGRPARSPAQDDLVRDAIRGLGLKVLTVTGATIMSEPKFSTARAIWSHRHFRVSDGMCMALESALDDGPLHLHELCSLVTGPQDPVGAIFSLVCAGRLEVDLNEWYGRNTLIRSRVDLF